jgi:hypothetical protein
MTKLNDHYLENIMAFSLGDMPPNMREATYDDYYYNICALIHNYDVRKFTTSGIEEYISDDRIKRDLFLSAQAKQLIYDRLNGRGSMMRGEDEKFNVCPDALDRLRLAGFLREAQILGWEGGLNGL